jgi:hypothetical protein
MPADPAAARERFRAVVARGIERAAREERELLERLRPVRRMPRVPTAPAWPRPGRRRAATEAPDEQTHGALHESAGNRLDGGERGMP